MSMHTPRTLVRLALQWGALASIAALAACTTVAPADNAMLNAATSSLRTAQAKPAVTTLAALEFQEAQEAVAQAQAAWSRSGTAAEVDHLAYIATRKVAVAEEVARQRIAEDNVMQAEDLRNRLLLEARTLEAQRIQQEQAAPPPR